MDTINFLDKAFTIHGTRTRETVFKRSDP
jgi:hypothetical protein